MTCEQFDAFLKAAEPWFVLAVIFSPFLALALLLEVGTDNTDDYYPYFVGSWNPANIAEPPQALEEAWAGSGNYVADKEVEPTEVKFDNGRVVRSIGGYLVIE